MWLEAKVRVVRGEGTHCVEGRDYPLAELNQCVLISQNEQKQVTTYLDSLPTPMNRPIGASYLSAKQVTDTYLRGTKLVTA